MAASDDEGGNSQSRDKNARFRSAYQFLVEREKNRTEFSLDELAEATGWKSSSASANLTKKLKTIVQRVEPKKPKLYRAVSVSSYTEEVFIRLMSQNQAVSANPQRPVLEQEVESLVTKARESALLALQIYNNPTAGFKTEAFSVLMVIAWTALFHAMFERDGVAYFYTESDGSPRLIDGDEKAWELSECARHHWAEESGPVRENLRFFTRFRNKVEHRYLPSIDPLVAGECQALLFNFDEKLVREFGQFYAINESLAVPLQTGNARSLCRTDALRELQARQYDQVRGFVDEYRAGLSDEVISDERYCFRVFLIPKAGNHLSSSDVAFEFVRTEQLTPEQRKDLDSKIALVRDRQVRVPVANEGLLSPTEVVTRIATELKIPFKPHHHVKAWRRYEVRPKEKPSQTRDSCKSEYCVPDLRHDDYSYTEKWVELLIEKLADPAEYASLVTGA